MQDDVSLVLLLKVTDHHSFIARCVYVKSSHMFSFIQRDL